MFPGFEHPMERADNRFHTVYTPNLETFFENSQNSSVIPSGDAYLSTEYKSQVLTERELKTAYETTNLLNRLVKEQETIEVSTKEFKYDQKGAG
jgi:hypothetical protein